MGMSFKADPPSGAHLDDCNSGQHFDFSQSTQLSHCQIPDPQKKDEIRNVCCFKPLRFGVICHEVIDNSYTYQIVPFKHMCCLMPIN